MSIDSIIVKNHDLKYSTNALHNRLIGPSFEDPHSNLNESLSPMTWRCVGDAWGSKRDVGICIRNADAAFDSSGDRG